MRRSITDAEFEKDLQNIRALSQQSYMYIKNMKPEEVKTFYLGLKVHIAAEAYKSNQTDKVKKLDRAVLDFFEKHLEHEIK